MREGASNLLLCFLLTTSPISHLTPHTSHFHTSLPHTSQPHTSCALQYTLFTADYIPFREKEIANCLFPSIAAKSRKSVDIEASLLPT